MAIQFLLFLTLCGTLAWPEDTPSRASEAPSARQASGFTAGRDEPSRRLADSRTTPSMLPSSGLQGLQGAARVVPSAATGISTTDRQIEALQDRVRKSPGNYSGYDQLGAAFLQKARETGDIAFYDLAEQTLKKSLQLVPQDFRAADPLVHMCLVYMGEHRFSDVHRRRGTRLASHSNGPPPFGFRQH